MEKIIETKKMEDLKLTNQIKINIEINIKKIIKEKIKILDKNQLEKKFQKKH